MDQASTQDLLDKARALAEHAVDSGRFPVHSRIYAVMQEVETARASGEIPALEPLILEMQLLAEDLGVTIDQLGQMHKWHGHMQGWTGRFTPYFIGFLTLMLTLYLAFQSSELHKADLALREHQDMLSERLQEKVYLAWKMYRYDDVLNVVKAQPLAQLDSYNKLVDDVRRVYAKRFAVQALLVDSMGMRYMPRMFESHGPCWTRAVARTLNGAPPPLAPSADCPDPNLQALQLPMLALPAFECSNRRIEPSASSRGSKLQERVDMAQYDRDFECFLRSLNLDSSYNLLMDEHIYATRSKVNLLISWLLPGLYGLLGACVFLMRRMLHSDRPGSTPSRVRAVQMLALLLRAALGGLAGVIVGWFWVPTMLTGNSSAIAISSLPFGIAFLAGFSIDSLFALLERLVRNIDGTDKAGSAPEQRQQQAPHPQPQPQRPT